MQKTTIASCANSTRKPPSTPSRSPKWAPTPPSRSSKGSKTAIGCSLPAIARRSAAVGGPAPRRSSAPPPNSPRAPTCWRPCSIAPSTSSSAVVRASDTACGSSGWPTASSCRADGAARRSRRTPPPTPPGSRSMCWKTPSSGTTFTTFGDRPARQYLHDQHRSDASDAVPRPRSDEHRLARQLPPLLRGGARRAARRDRLRLPGDGSVGLRLADRRPVDQVCPPAAPRPGIHRARNAQGVREPDLHGLSGVRCRLARGPDQRPHRAGRGFDRNRRDVDRIAARAHRLRAEPPVIPRRQMLGAALAAALVQSAAMSQAQTLTLAGGEVLRGRFTQQRFLQGFNAPLTSTGSFILAPGRGVLWRAET